MSLLLEQGTKPEGTLVKTTHPIGSCNIMIGDLAISAEDFAEIVKYWFINTDLGANDVRIDVLELLKTAVKVPGYNFEKQRLQPTLPQQGDLEKLEESCLDRLKVLSKSDDEEGAHSEGDDILCSLLTMLGYGDMVDHYTNIMRHCA